MTTPPDNDDAYQLNWWFDVPTGNSANATIEALELPVVLSATQPLSWAAKLERVRWVREYFTPGELAELYKLSYDVDHLRRAECDHVIARESAAPKGSNAPR